MSKKTRVLPIKVKWDYQDQKADLPEHVRFSDDLFDKAIKESLQKQYGAPVKSFEIDKEDKIAFFMEGLTAWDKDTLYYQLWEEHVREDVSSFLEEELEARKIEVSDEVKEDIIARAAYLYVYEGEYDCNLNYWDNIKNLLDRDLDKYDAA